MAFNLPTTIRNLFSSKSFGQSNGFESANLDKMSWKSMFLILVKLASQIALELLLALFLAYLFVMYSVYSIMSQVVSDFSSGASWWESPILAGILFVVIADIVTGYIFSGLIRKKNKLIAMALIVVLIVLSAFGQYNTRHTKIVGQYMCYDDPEKGMFISKVKENKFTHEECEVIPASMFLSAVAVIDGAAPRKLTFGSPAELENYPLAKLGKSQLYVSIHKDANGNNEFYDAAGPGNKHTKGNMDLLIPAKQEHKDHNLRNLKATKVSDLNEKISSLRAGLEVVNSNIANLPNQKPLVTLMPKGGNASVKVPENYVVEQIRDAEQRGDTVHVNCKSGNVIFSAFSEVIGCTGYVIFKKDTTELNKRKISILHEISETENKIRGMGGTVTASTFNPADQVAKKEEKPREPLSDEELKRLEKDRAANMAIVNNESMPAEPSASKVVVTETKTKEANNAVKNDEPWLYFDFLNTEPSKTSFTFHAGQNGNKVHRNITIRVDQKRCKRGTVNLASNKLLDITDICDVKKLDLSAGDEYNIINNSGIVIISKNSRS